LQLLPVIAVTASSHPGEEGDLRNQFTGYVRKPFSRQTLYQELAQVLRRGPLQTKNSGETVILIPIPSPASQVEWRTLTVTLRRLVETEWPLLRDSLAIHQTQAFGQKLRSLGNAAGCNPLVVYASTLTTLAEGYAVTE